MEKGRSPGPPPETPLFRYRWLVAAAIFILLVAAFLWPRGGTASGIYAQSVVDFRQGRIQTQGCPETDVKAVLGPPDNRYVSLGIGGRILLDLPQPVRDVRDLLVYEVTGPSLFVPSQPRTPLVQSIGNGTIAFIQVSASPAWPLGGEEIARIDFDPASRTAGGFTRIVISDESQEPVKCVSGIDIDAVEVIPGPV